MLHEGKRYISVTAYIYIGWIPYFEPSTFTGESCSGPAVDFGGYYKPDLAKLETLMRPSQTFNAALQKLE